MGSSVSQIPYLTFQTTCLQQAFSRVDNFCQYFARCWTLKADLMLIWAITNVGCFHIEKRNCELVSYGFPETSARLTFSSSYINEDIYFMK